MAMTKEPLNSGLVTARDATLLADGELQQADDLILKPYSAAVHRLPGRLAYGTVEASYPVKGLAHLAFDEAGDQLIAWGGPVGTKLFSSPFSAVTGTFTGMGLTLVAGTNDQMDTIQFQGANYLLLGAQNRPRRVAYNAPTDGNPPVLVTRAMGMEPVDPGASGSTTPFSVATMAGSWPLLLGDGVYWFLVTEVYNPGQADEVESTFIPYDKNGKPYLQYVTITSYATQSVIVTRHAPLINDGTDGKNTANAWRIYMSNRAADAATVPALAEFSLVATVGGQGTALADVPTTFQLGAANGTFGWGATGATGFASAVVAWSGVYTQFTSPTNMLGRRNGTYATSSNDLAANVLQKFAIPAITGTITGIEVTVFGQWTNDGNSSVAGAWVSLSKNAELGSSATEYTSPRREFRFNASENVTRYGNDIYAGWVTVGGPGDAWGKAWVAADFVDDGSAEFGAIIGKIGTAHNDTLRIDAVGVRVFSSGAIIDKTLNRPFRYITLESEIGVTTSYGADFPPPNADTGDVLDGQIVLNDPLKPHAIRYSVPDKPESFPPPYVIAFQSKKLNRVTCIRRVGNLMVVGMVSSIVRLNYLPRQTDADFDRSRCFEDISTVSGIPGKNAACIFDMGQGPMLAYASQTGLRATDGMTDQPLNIDLDWAATVKVSALSSAVLRNDVQNQALVLYYTPYGGTANTKALQFSYNRLHVKSGGQLPAMGPLNVAARSTAQAEINGVPYLLTGHSSDGVVYVENSGLVPEAGGTISPVLRTRLQYIADLGSKARIHRVYARTSAAGTAFTAAGNTTLSTPTTVTSSATFTNVTVGMKISGAGIQPGTKVSAKASSSSITISLAAIAAGTGVTLTFSTGAIELTVRGQNVGEAIGDRVTLVADTLVGGLIRTHLDAQAEAHEVKIVKLPTVVADLSVHYIGLDVVSHGKEQSNR